MALNPGSFEAILKRAGCWDESLLFALDFGDSRCYPGGGPYVHDLGPQQYKFIRGTSATAVLGTTSPTFNGVPGNFAPAASTTDFNAPSFFSTDGGDVLLVHAPGKRQTIISSATYPHGSISYIAIFSIASAATLQSLIGTSISVTAGNAHARCEIGATPTIIEIADYDGGSASATRDARAIGATAFATDTWSLFAASINFTQSDPPLHGGASFLQRGSFFTDVTDPITAASNGSAIERLVLFGRIDDAAPTTITNPVLNGGRLMLAAMWWDRFIHAEEQERIRDELRAWRVAGLE